MTFVQNFTDIDDKMIKRANEEGITVEALADRFIAEYYKDADALGVQRAGARLQKRLSELAKTLNAQKTTQGGRVFYWRRDSAPTEYRLLRTPKPGTRRDPAELCPYEMANAAVLALQSEGPLPEEALLRAMARLPASGRSHGKRGARGRAVRAFAGTHPGTGRTILSE